MHISFPLTFCSHIVPDWVTFHHSKSLKSLPFLFACLTKPTKDRGEQGTTIFIIASEGISGIHVSPSPAKQSQLNTSHNICKTRCFCLNAEGLRMGLLLLWERNWRETGCRPYGKCPSPATLRGWVACCWTQHWWRDIWNPAVDFTADILPVLWVVAAAITAANLVFHGPGTASWTTAYLVHTWG